MVSANREAWRERWNLFLSEPGFFEPSLIHSSIFTWRITDFLFEETSEVLRIFKSQLISCFTDRFAVVKYSFFCNLNLNYN